MAEKLGSEKRVMVLRWVARIWSALLLAFAVLMFIFPDSQATVPMSTEDKFMLGLLGVAILGLVIAWRWERFGAYLAIFALVLQQLSWLLIRGNWFPGFVIFWLLILPPAVLFLIAWRMTRAMTNGLLDEGGLK